MIKEENAETDGFVLLDEQSFEIPHDDAEEALSNHFDKNQTLLGMADKENAESSGFVRVTEAEPASEELDSMLNPSRAG